MHDRKNRAELVEEQGLSNESGNRPFQEVLEARVTRRHTLAGGLAAAAATFFGGSTVALADGGRGRSGHEDSWRRGARLLDFQPVPIEDGTGPMPAISADYDYQVIIPWGDPVNPGFTPEGWLPWDDGDLAAFDPRLMNAAQQAERIGIGHDGMWYFPFDGGSVDDDRDDDDDRGRRGHDRHSPRGRRGREAGMLCINHEFGRNSHVFGVGNGAGNDSGDPQTQPQSLEDVRKSQHAHGVSVVAIAQERSGDWRVIPNANSRRIHVNTPVRFSGPVAGSALIDAARGGFMGTVNNCANGYTPWGTYLTCEENFNGYFGATDPSWAPTPEQARYGFDADGFEYGWEKFDARFDLSNPATPNEENRFGWVVEIDPMDGSQLPVKRTALGRFKHEGVAVGVGKGKRVVCYMGDDERFDYIYKFVSAGNWKAMRRRGMSPLDQGTLYVARFDEDHTGEWLELSPRNPALAGWTEEQILTYTRLAADAVGATPMDRPEWTTIAPGGEVYCTLTNNGNRTVADAANPLAPNADGHIIRWRDSDDLVGTTFEWDIFLIAQNTHAPGNQDTYSDPDGLWADPDGRLFIQTDGGQKKGLNNQMLVADTNTGQLRRMFTGVTDDEITGLTVTPDRRTLFCNTQHPGNGNIDDTNFPLPFNGQTVPRDATFVIRRRNGGIVGS